MIGVRIGLVSISMSMSLSRRGLALGALAMLGFGALAGCSDDRIIQGAAPVRETPAAAETPDGGPTVHALHNRDLSDSDFAEGETNRDPFRSFAKVFGIEATEAHRPQVPVICERYGLDELRLTGIVALNGSQPVAMLIDPTGVGWPVHRGDWIGRAEATGDEERVLYWRVAQIRPDSVVFLRQDPSGRPSAEAQPRVLALHPTPEQESRR